ncbi:hypothetical protein FMM68_11835 [Lachnospiraceae bacterium MD329]|nr:hypothetical protein [Lachnospiraceae bacterium MD329]
MNCKNCKHCKYSEGGNHIGTYTCEHPRNPDSVNHIGGVTRICKTERHSTEMTRKRTPKWCPQE